MVNHDPSTSDAASTSVESPSTASAPGDSTTAADLDAVFAALQHPRRRYLLSALADRDGEQSLTCLATDVVAREEDQPREDVCTEARQRCRIALHHVHLPKLSTLGILHYDPDDEPTVRPADTGAVTTILGDLRDELDATRGVSPGRDGA